MKNKFLISLIMAFIVSCAPQVQLQAPDKPIEINLNVKVKVEIEKDVKKAIAKNPDIF
jgi:hypothetical protein